MLDVLTPCIMLHYFSRVGQLRSRNVMLTNFIPAVYVTGKSNYQYALLFDVIEKVTMPDVAYAYLYDGNDTAANISGTVGNNLHNDECLEIMCVLPTKIGARNATADCLEASFYSTEYCNTVAKKLLSTVTFNSLKTKLVDCEARSNNCVAEMLDKLRKQKWMGLEHRALPALTNVLSHNTLALSEMETQKGLDKIKHGKRVLDLHGQLVFFLWRDMSKATKKWTRKHPLLLFAGARVRKDRDTVKVRKARLKRQREEQLRKTLRVRALTLVDAQKRNNTELCVLIESNMDLIHPDA